VVGVQRLCLPYGGPRPTVAAHDRVQPAHAECRSARRKFPGRPGAGGPARRATRRKAPRSGRAPVASSRNTEEEARRAFLAGVMVAGSEYRHRLDTDATPFDDEAFREAAKDAAEQLREVFEADQASR